MSNDISSSSTNTELPSAIYTAPNDNIGSHINHKFTIEDPNLPKYNTTNGKTSGPSEYLTKKAIDSSNKEDIINKDNASMPSRDSFLGELRMQLTGLQDDINEYLTERMNDNIANIKRLKK
ncbi:chromatin DNA-binding EKC/KEOPS complex subunit GON7 SCDLUD_003944 [Saccharomycodes ludwigii]|uniref:chromatin DNA-binding EKC/KEOPS complex subunit GON7 n=1 Tax=Saccharomycodes ludwigii TaxID=36035 RepID=UPI001E8A5F57|nr:hypothetical protein SCDLUD_003944 [Saccharomycodes ludwigii]KAH3899661.1 hypothetical protein SCDLUD_003944 [Saccharomycodes ludwigii]